MIPQLESIYFGIQFLNPADAVQFCNTELYYLVPDDDRVVSFRQYLDTTYFKEGAMCGAVTQTLSTGLQTIVNRSTQYLIIAFITVTPNLFYFTSVLLDFQTEIYLKIKSANNRSTKPIRKTVLDKVNFVEDNLIKYKNGVMSRYSLVHAILFKYLP